ncbi:hypothetical protein [Spirillospora sp. CA-294931]|uniref:GAP1-N2 domain-containing protein n=1 Tax=Spirillospora sp. CA-294931 TaxID=3240042 RepID=UPI003D90D914
MAWQLHYTSAQRGPTGRAGFQFVAETPGLPEGARAGVTPYLSYRPPPGAPLSPDAGELDRFPVTLLYDRVGGRPLLLRCRYLGRDYSGRYGNFFAHAVVADQDELEGLRPAELWRAPLWTDRPADSPDLPELDELVPGTAADPEALAGWLAAEGAHPLLERVVDAVAGVLARGHGRVVLVAGDVELIARWIAVVSYSLPVAAAARLSFVTYSADPESAGQRLVGTTPDVWASTPQHASRAFHLAGPASSEPDGEPSRFARTVAACWRDFDFAGLDALGELALLDGAPLDRPVLERAATLLRLCRGEAPVTAEEEADAAGLLTRHGTAIPEWVWRDLVAGVPSMGFELAMAVHGWARAAGAERVARQCAVRATGLALADPALRDALPRGLLDGAAPDALGSAIAGALAAAPDLAEVARVATVAVRAGAEVGPREIAAAAARHVPRDAGRLPQALSGCPDLVRDAVLDGVVPALTDASALTDAACDVLAEHAGRLEPAVAVAVLASTGRRDRGRRLAVTAELLARGGPGTDRALDEVWKAAPTAAECLELIDAHAAALPSRPALLAQPPRAFALAPDAPETLRLAARVLRKLPETGAALDAAAVRALHDAVAAEKPGIAAKALETIARGRTERLVDRAFDHVAARLSRRDPRFRAALLAAASTAVRARLGGLWTAALPGRARAGRSSLRGAEVAQRNELVEVVLRLRVLGVTEPALETWARAAAGRWISARQLDSHLSGEPELRAALKDLLAGGE